LSTAILFIYALYTAVCVCAFKFILCVKCPETALFGLLTSLLIPPFGLVFALAIKRSGKHYGDEAGEKENFILSPISAEVEKFRVPISEALILNDHTVCCALLMDALKNDPSNYLFGIREALAKGDPETAHYAAAAVMEIKRILLNSIRELGVSFQDGSLTAEEKGEYVEVLKKALDSQLFDSYNESWLQSLLEEVLDSIVSTNPSPKVFSDRAELAISKHDYAEAIKYANEYIVRYPEEEDAYLISIQCLTAMRDTEGLQAFINDLKNRPVKLTVKTLQYVRYMIDTGIVA